MSSPLRIPLDIRLGWYDVGLFEIEDKFFNFLISGINNFRLCLTVLDQ